VRPSLSPLSTCIGCGLRAANIVLQDARPGAVWVVVLFTDGVANLSDTAGSGGSGPGDTPWTGGRWCPMNFQAVSATAASTRAGGRACAWTPPSSRATAWTPIQTPARRVRSGRGKITRTVHQLQRDGLCPRYGRRPGAHPLHQPGEPPGNDVAVYTIGLGAVSLGEPLLRYIAAVGHGRRPHHRRLPLVLPHSPVAVSIITPAGLEDWCEIFEDIATRIYTRITN
jgi:hypothetical protein